MKDSFGYWIIEPGNIVIPCTHGINDRFFELQYGLKKLGFIDAKNEALIPFKVSSKGFAPEATVSAYWLSVRYEEMFEKDPSDYGYDSKEEVMRTLLMNDLEWLRTHLKTPGKIDGRGTIPRARVI